MSAETVLAGNAIIEQTKGLIGRLLGPTFGEIGELFADRVRMVRFERQLKLMQRAVQILDADGVKQARANLKVLLPLLDKAALEDDAELSEKWAALLASASDPQTQSASDASFVEIMNQLSPSDAFVLDVFYEQIRRYNTPEQKMEEVGVQTAVMRAFLPLQGNLFEIALDNLLRLRLVTYPTLKIDALNGNDVRLHVTSAGILCATHLGIAFTNALKRARPRLAAYGVPSNSIENVFDTKEGTLRSSPSVWL